KVVLPAPLAPMSPSLSPSARSKETFASARTMTVSLWAARLPPRREKTAVRIERVWDEKIGKAMLTSRSATRAMVLNPVDDAALTVADYRQCDDESTDREDRGRNPIIEGRQLTE